MFSRVLICILYVLTAAEMIGFGRQTPAMGKKKKTNVKCKVECRKESCNPHKNGLTMVNTNSNVLNVIAGNVFNLVPEFTR